MQEFPRGVQLQGKAKRQKTVAENDRNPIGDLAAEEQEDQSGRFGEFGRDPKPAPSRAAGALAIGEEEPAEHQVVDDEEQQNRSNVDHRPSGNQPAGAGFKGGAIRDDMALSPRSAARRGAPGRGLRHSPRQWTERFDGRRLSEDRPHYRERRRCEHIICMRVSILAGRVISVGSTGNEPMDGEDAAALTARIAERGYTARQGVGTNGSRRRNFRPGSTVVRHSWFQRPSVALRPALRIAARSGNPEKVGDRLDRGDSDPGHPLHRRRQTALVQPRSRRLRPGLRRGPQRKRVRGIPGLARR